MTFSAEAVDRTSNLETLISASHRKIHEGHTFCAHVVSISSTTVNIAFRTPLGVQSKGSLIGKQLHMTVRKDVASKVHLSVARDAVWTAGTGTVINPMNANHSSINTSGVREDKTDTPNWTEGGVLSNVTVTDPGTLTHIEYIFVSDNWGSLERDGREVILDYDTNYLFTITSDNGAQGMLLGLRWYENTLVNT
jgi:hypothetical protein